MAERHSGYKAHFVKKYIRVVAALGVLLVAIAVVLMISLFFGRTVVRIFGSVCHDEEKHAHAEYEKATY